MTNHFSYGGAAMPTVSKLNIREGVHTGKEGIHLVFEGIKYCLPQLQGGDAFIEYNSLLYVVNNNGELFSLEQYYEGNKLFWESYKEMKHFFGSSTDAAGIEFQGRALEKIT